MLRWGEVASRSVVVVVAPIMIPDLANPMFLDHCPPQDSVVVERGRGLLLGAHHQQQQVVLPADGRRRYVMNYCPTVDA